MSKKISKNLTKEQRLKAAIDMTGYYLDAFWPEWRYVQIITIKKLIHTKYDFYKSITEEIYGEADEAIIAQNIRNGLILDAIAHCIQYIEDMFALINASKNPDYFIRDIITYQAGQVTSTIKTFKPTTKSLGSAFHFPAELKWSDTEKGEKFMKSVEYLKETVDRIIKFYRDYEFFYIQYKHGLTIPIKPFGNNFSPEQIQKEKDGLLEPFIVAFDNFNLHANVKRNTFSIEHGVMMPGFTDNVKNYISALQDEDNYLRFVFPPDRDIKIDLFVEVARLVKQCILIFRYNYWHKLTDEKNAISFQLPFDIVNNQVNQYMYQADG